VTVGETDFAAAVVMRSASTPGALPGCSPVAAWPRASTADEPPPPVRSPPPVPSRETEEEAKPSPQANSWDGFIFESCDVPPPPTLDTSVAATSWAAERREPGRPLLDELLEIREQHGEKVGQGERDATPDVWSTWTTAAVPPSPVETGNGSRGGAARGRRGTGGAECPGPVRDGRSAKGGRRMGENGERERLLATAGAWRRRAPAPSPPASRRRRAISVQPAGLFGLAAEQC
jgi:hypothetical protein